MGSLPPHKFVKYTKTHEDYLALPETTNNDDSLHFSLEVYMDDFIGAAAAKSRRQLDHVGRANLHGVHDVFLPAKIEEEDPNLVKKLRKGDGAWALDKDLLGFDFNGDNRTVILDAQKRDALLTKLKDWTRATRRRGRSAHPVLLVLSSQSFGKSFANCEMQQSVFPPPKDFCMKPAS